MRTTLFALALSAIPVASAAMTSELSSGLGDLGLEIRWTGETMVDGRLFLDGVTIQGPQARLSSEGAVWSPETGRIAFMPGSVTSIAGDDGASTAGFHALEIDSLSSLAFLGDFSFCTESPSEAVSSSLRYERLTVRGWRPATEMAQPVERLDAARLEGGLLVSMPERCFAITSAEMEQVVVTGADRSRAHIGLVFVEGAAPAALSSSLRAEVRDLRFFLPDGAPAAAIGDIGIELTSSMPEPASRSAGDVLDAMASGTLQFALRLRGIDLPVRSLFAEDVHDPSALPERLQGGLDLELRHTGEDVVARFEGMMPGLAAFEAGLDLKILSAGQTAGMGQLFEGPGSGMDVIERLALASASLRFENLGVVSVMEHVLDRSSETMLASLDRRLRVAPTEIGGIVMDFATRAIAGSATISMLPGSPVTAAQASMTGLMRPGRLVGLLGLEAN